MSQDWNHVDELKIIKMSKFATMAKIKTKTLKNGQISKLTKILKF